MKTTPVHFPPATFRHTQFERDGLAVTPEELERVLSAHFGRKITFDGDHETVGFIVSAGRGRIANFLLSDYPIDPDDMRETTAVVRQSGTIESDDLAFAIVLLHQAGLIPAAPYIVLPQAVIDLYPSPAPTGKTPPATAPKRSAAKAVFNV
jgi:hypothetical protein